MEASMNRTPRAAFREAYKDTWRRLIILVTFLKIKHSSSQEMFLLLEEKTSSIVAKATNHKPLGPSPMSRKTNYLSPGNSATVVQKFCSELFGGFCPCISVLELGTTVENCAGSDVNLQTENDGQEMLLWLGERSTVTPLFRHAKALKSCVQQNFNEFILYPAGKKTSIQR